MGTKPVHSFYAMVIKFMWNPMEFLYWFSEDDIIYSKVKTLGKSRKAFEPCWQITNTLVVVGCLISWWMCASLATISCLVICIPIRTRFRTLWVSMCCRQIALSMRKKQHPCPKVIRHHKTHSCTQFDNSWFQICCFSPHCLPVNQKFAYQTLLESQQEAGERRSD